MTVEQLKRVMWIIKEEHKSLDKISLAMLRKAIMHECGTDPRTITKHTSALLKLGWIRRRNTGPFDGYLYIATEEGKAI